MDAKLDEFIPLPLGWITKWAQNWRSEDTGPILLVVFYLWPKGGRARNDPKQLAKVAGVSPKAWERIRHDAAGFFHVDAGDLVQEDLVALYKEKARVFRSNRTKAQKAANSLWGRKRAADALRAAAEASGNAPSIASGDASSNAPAYAPASLRADLFFDLKNSGIREGSSATTVPVSPDDPEITETLRRYPRTRKIPGGGETEVRIGEDARTLAAQFLTQHPGYPLALAASYIAARDKMPRDFANFLASPPSAEIVLSAWEEKQRAQAARAVGDAPVATPETLRGLVAEINAHAERSPDHAHA